MVRRLKDLIGRLIFWTGLHRFVLKDRAIILAFHSINDEDSSNSYNCSVRQFRQYCRFLNRHFDVVGLDELVESLDSPRFRSVAVLTFDDGYMDNYTNALPVLQSYSFPATVYVITNEMEPALHGYPQSRLSGDIDWLDWKTTVKLAQSGITIGAHTRSHQNLGAVDIDVARQELAGCKKGVSENAGSDVVHFAYPYGGPFNMNDAVRKEIVTAGFRSCVTCYGGLVKSSSDVLELPREPISTWYLSPYHFGFEVLLKRLKNVNGLPDEETRNWGK